MIYVLPLQSYFWAVVNDFEYKFEKKNVWILIFRVDKAEWEDSIKSEIRKQRILTSINIYELWWSLAVRRMNGNEKNND